MRDAGDENGDDTAGGGFAARAYGFVRRPFVAGILAAFLSAIVAAAILPGGVSPAPEALVAVTAQTATDQAAPVAEAPAPVKAQPLNEPAPPADPPISAEAAVVVADAGLNHRVAEAIDSALPRDATLAISVYAADPVGMASAFRESGRDVWLQIAVQSSRARVDPGPLAISSTMTEQENQDLLNRQIAMAGGNAVGLFVPEDAEITANDPDMWRDLAMDVIGNNLMILDATKAKVATSLYMKRQEARINAYLKADLTLNGQMGPAALKSALAQAEALILNRQQAIIVLAAPSAPTVETLGAWIDTLRHKGIRLVPASKFTGLKG
ncbi:MAG: divergent polysaccharide deacetylase family protein [Rhodospirillales bacterium]|nr:divergent polysaccharide deacetylase family protein [Alphaproteobacteria bacterium]MCB9987387.1 divergent polysaccharide deacetylase family protein [Rhodospirillales bacterium]USO07631.1 MAG: divergent polysaccharide deacetylase family protein [Rhodospirillales bacterium]